MNRLMEKTKYKYRQYDSGTGESISPVFLHKKTLNRLRFRAVRMAGLEPARF